MGSLTRRPLLSAERLSSRGAALNEHYRSELGEDFEGIGLCLYRVGRDSVAWHGDNIGRGATSDTMVAVLSLGGTRYFALRPRGGGNSIQSRPWGVR